MVKRLLLIMSLVFPLTSGAQVYFQSPTTSTKTNTAGMLPVLSPQEFQSKAGAMAKKEDDTFQKNYNAQLNQVVASRKQEEANEQKTQKGTTNPAPVIPSKITTTKTTTTVAAPETPSPVVAAPIETETYTPSAVGPPVKQTQQPVYTGFGGGTAPSTTTGTQQNTGSSNSGGWNVRY